MKNKELNDSQIEQLVRDSMTEVGKRHDDAIVDALSEMTDKQLDELLGEKQRMEIPVKTKNRSRIMTFVRLAVACAILLLIIVGIEHLNLGGTSQNGYASLFNTYYKEYKVSGETFSAGKDKLNAHGKANTAYIIQEASRLISKKHSRQALHKGIGLLEDLLTLQYKPELEHEIHWYLGLAYLKDNRITKARDEFQKVIYLNSSHSADAKTLLEQME